MQGWGPTEQWVTQDHLNAWRSENPDYAGQLRALILAGRIGIVAYCGSKGQTFDTLTREEIDNMLGERRLAIVKEVA